MRGRRLTSTGKSVRNLSSPEAEPGGLPSGSDRGEQLARTAVLVVVALLGLVAVGLALGSFASYGWVKRQLDSFASDGDADLTRADFDGIVTRLRVAALLVILAAGVTYAGRRRLGRTLAALARSAAAAVASLRRALVVTLADESPVHLGALALVTVGAVVVRLEFLFQPMRYDESVTYVHYASRPWYITLTNYTAPNNHVLHSLLVHLSTSVFGGEPWAIRLPAFVAGVLLVPATYVAARLFYGRAAALVAGALVASSSVLVEFSTNARGYTLVAFVFVLMLALATRLRTSWNAAEWLALAILAGLGFWTVPIMLYGFGAIVVWLGASILSAGERTLFARRLIPSTLVAGVLSLLLYAPIIASSGIGPLVSNEFVGSRSWSYFTANLPDSLVSVVKGWHRDIPLPLAALVGAMFVAALVLHSRLSRFGLPPALATLAWIGPVLVAQRVVPYERVWLFLLPLYLMTAAAGLVFALRPLAARVGRPDTVAIVVALVLAGSLAGNVVATQSVYRSEDTSTFRDSAAVAAFLASRLRPGDKILVAPPADAILEYRLGRRGLDPAALLYWAHVGTTRRLFVVVKLGPRDYRLPHLLGDPRIARLPHGSPRLVQRFPGARVYELLRRGPG